MRRDSLNELVDELGRTLPTPPRYWAGAAAAAGGLAVGRDSVGLCQKGRRPFMSPAGSGREPPVPASGSGSGRSDRSFAHAGVKRSLQIAAARTVSSNRRGRDP